MRLPVTQLSSVLYDAIKQVRDAACRLTKDNIASLGALEEFTVEVELVPEGGWNAVQRTEIDRPGVQTSREERPATTTTTVQDPATTVSEEDAFVTVATEVRTAAPSTSTKTEDASVRRSTKTGGGGSMKRESSHTSSQNGGQDNRGGDLIKQDYTVEAT